MNLLYVHHANFRTPSANTIQVTRMGKAFAAQGVRVTLLYPSFLWGNELRRDELPAFYDLEEGESHLRLRTLAAPFTPGLSRSDGYRPLAKVLGYLLASLRLRCTSTRHRPQVIYTRCYAAAFAFRRLVRLFPAAHRPRILFESHDFPESRSKAAALGGVDGLVAITESLCRDLIERLDLPPERLLVAADGVLDRWLEEDPEESGSVPDARDALRRQLGLASLGIDLQLPLAIYTGRLHPGTQRDLIDTATALGDTVEMVVVGSPPGSWSSHDPALTALRREAAERGLTHLRFLGPVPAAAVRDYQRAADLLLAPYTGELSWSAYTSPLKLFEYMAAGRPIVASALPVLEEVLTHGENAWLVPRGEPDGLASGVRHLLDHPGLASALARRARQDVRSHTWGHRARQVLDFIDHLPPGSMKP